MQGWAREKVDIVNKKLGNNSVCNTEEKMEHNEDTMRERGSEDDNMDDVEMKVDGHTMTALKVMR